MLNAIFINECYYYSFITNINSKSSSKTHHIHNCNKITVKPPYNGLIQARDVR